MEIHSVIEKQDYKIKAKQNLNWVLHKKTHTFEWKVFYQLISWNYNFGFNSYYNNRNLFYNIIVIS